MQCKFVVTGFLAASMGAVPRLGLWAVFPRKATAAGSELGGKRVVFGWERLSIKCSRSAFGFCLYVVTWIMRLGKLGSNGKNHFFAAPVAFDGLGAEDRPAAGE